MVIPARRDADLTDDRQIQGNWIDSSHEICDHRCAHPLLQEPRLRDLINLDPMTRVNADKDVQPTGQFEIYNASETMSAIFSLDGAFLGSMRKRTIEALAQAYRNELGDFPQAIAKLIARYYRYKDGSKSGTHTVAYKNCYTAPTSLTTALSIALGTTTELFATPFDFNPEMKHCYVPFAEDIEFRAHPDAFSFMWPGSCYCHPEPSNAQMLKTLRWALACTSIQTEPLLVTLLLPERPKSAFTSLLSQPSVLLYRKYPC